MRTGKERAEASNEYTIRIDGIVDLASSMECDQFFRPDGIHEDLVDDLTNGWKDRYDESMRPLFDAFDGVDIEDCVDDEIAHYICRHGLFGYVTRFATPIYNHADETSASYSWGYYTSNWFYGDTIEECWERAVEWSKKHKDKAIAETAARDKVKQGEQANG